MEEQRLEYASWVNTKNMQPIVDKISPLIWTDINIVNMDSIIIALSCPYFSDSFLIDYTENAM